MHKAVVIIFLIFCITKSTISLATMPESGTSTSFGSKEFVPKKKRSKKNKKLKKNKSKGKQHKKNLRKHPPGKVMD